MDYQDYSNFSFHNNDHVFLRNLSEIPDDSSKKQIEQLAKKILKMNIVDAVTLDVSTKIMHSFKNIQNDHLTRPSLQNYEQEIDGALRGLNILYKNETSDFKKERLKRMIFSIVENEKQLKTVFRLKSNLSSDPTKEALIRDPLFVKNFSSLENLYGGNRRKMSPANVQLFATIWTQPKLQIPLINFIETAQKARELNLNLLKENKFISFEEPHNQELIDKDADLTQLMMQQGLEKEIKNIKKFFGEIINNRVLITNTQIHTDGLSLAFNSEAQDPLSLRIRTTQLKNQSDYESELQRLQQELEEKKVEPETVRNWQKLKDYSSRSVGEIYEKAEWVPVIGPNDPIQPLTRVVGFATKEGYVQESATQVDFSQFLDEDNLNLNLGERRLLSSLLQACDGYVLEKGRKIEEENNFLNLTESISSILKDFNLDQYPHLKSLTDEQKQNLVKEALNFASEVNYHLSFDLLNLI